MCVCVYKIIIIKIGGMNLRGVGGVGRRRVNVGWNDKNIVLIWEILKYRLKIKLSPTNKLIHYF